MHKAYKKTEITRIMEPLSPTPQDNQNPVNNPATPPEVAPTPMPPAPTPMNQPAPQAPMPAAPAPAPQAPMPSPAASSTAPMGAPAPQMQQPTPMAGQPAPSMGGAKPKVPKLAKMIIIGLVALLVLGGGGFGIFKLVGSLGGGVSLVEYKNSKYDFSISHPEGWEKDKLDDTRIAFSEPEDKTDESDTAKFISKMEIVAIDTEGQEKNIETSDDYFELLREELEAAFALESEAGKETFVGDPTIEEIEVGGEKALLVDGMLDNFSDEEGETGSASIVFIFISVDIQIAITIESHESDIKYYEAFDDILGTFKYEG